MSSCFEPCQSLVCRNLEPSRPRVVRKRLPFCRRETYGLTGEVGACQSDDWLGKIVRLVLR